MSDKQKVHVRYAILAATALTGLVVASNLFILATIPLIPFVHAVYIEKVFG